jgi:hypothetical protein
MAGFKSHTKFIRFQRTQRVDPRPISYLSIPIYRLFSATTQAEKDQIFLRQLMLAFHQGFGLGLMPL